MHTNNLVKLAQIYEKTVTIAHKIANYIYNLVKPVNLLKEILTKLIIHQQFAQTWSNLL